MLTSADFLTQYEECRNEELYQMHMNIADYSEDAQEALKIVIEKRGGLEKLFENHQYQLQIAKEKHRIRQETEKLYVNDTNVAFLKNLITSNLISAQETEQIIEAKFSELRLAHEDKQIKPRTVFGSLIGGIVGSIAGGVLWGPANDSNAPYIFHSHCSPRSNQLWINQGIYKTIQVKHNSLNRYYFIGSRCFVYWTTFIYNVRII